MSKLRFWTNWLRWAIKCRTIPPKSVGYVSHRKPTAEDIRRGLELAKEMGLTNGPDSEPESRR